MRYFLTIFILLVGTLAKGQHFPIYSQYMLNGLVINPAYAGSRDVLSSSVSYRQQWIGFDGAPVTYTFSAHTPLKNRKIGAGLQVISEKIGVTNNTSIFGNYAYRVRLGNGRLSFGLKAGIEMLKENDAGITTPQPDDLFTHSQTYVLPNFGFGIYYFSNLYFAGLSVPQLLSYRQSAKTKGYEPYNDFSNDNFLLTGGGIIWITDFFKLKPSTLIKFHLNSPLQYDLNLNAILLKDGILWLGASYRNKEAWVGLLEFQMGTKYRMGLSYDYSLGPISNYNHGSIEVMLRMELITIVKTINPRFF